MLKNTILEGVKKSGKYEPGNYYWLGIYVSDSMFKGPDVCVRLDANYVRTHLKEIPLDEGPCEVKDLREETLRKLALFEGARMVELASSLTEDMFS